MKTETPLLKFMRALNTEDRNKFAEACESTTYYLYQLAANEKPNPRLRLAIAICEASKVFSAKMPRVMRVPPLTFEDLLVGAKVINED